MIGNALHRNTGCTTQTPNIMHVMDSRLSVFSLLCFLRKYVEVNLLHFLPLYCPLLSLTFPILLLYQTFLYWPPVMVQQLRFLYPSYLPALLHLCSARSLESLFNTIPCSALGSFAPHFPLFSPSHQSAIIAPLLHQFSQFMFLCYWAILVKIHRPHWFSALLNLSALP